MPNGLLLDTDILIDYLRGNEQAVEFLENLSAPVLSSISVGELYSGVREGKETAALEEFLEGFEIIPVTSEIAKKGGLLCRDFRKSNGVGLADAMIAATALAHDLNLASLNVKHYPMFEAPVVPYTKTN